MLMASLVQLISDAKHQCRQAYLIIQVVVQVIPEQQVDQSFLAMLIVSEDRGAVQRQEVTAANQVVSLTGFRHFLANVCPLC